jgi:hypothetical protein
MPGQYMQRPSKFSRPWQHTEHTNVPCDRLRRHCLTKHWHCQYLTALSVIVLTHSPPLQEALKAVRCHLLLGIQCNGIPGSQLWLGSARLQEGMSWSQM